MAKYTTVNSRESRNKIRNFNKDISELKTTILKKNSQIINLKKRICEVSVESDNYKSSYNILYSTYSNLYSHYTEIMNKYKNLLNNSSQN